MKTLGTKKKHTDHVTDESAARFFGKCRSSLYRQQLPSPPHHTSIHLQQCRPPSNPCPSSSGCIRAPAPPPLSARSCSAPTLSSFHEPIGDPFYLGKDRPCRRFDDEHAKASGNYELTVTQVLEKVLNPTKEDMAKNKPWPPKYVFLKDMGHASSRPTASSAPPRLESLPRPRQRYRFEAVRHQRSCDREPHHGPHLDPEAIPTLVPHSNPRKVHPELLEVRPRGSLRLDLLGPGRCGLRRTQDPLRLDRQFRNPPSTPNPATTSPSHNPSLPPSSMPRRCLHIPTTPSRAYCGDGYSLLARDAQLGFGTGRRVGKVGWISQCSRELDWVQEGCTAAEKPKKIADHLVGAVEACTEPYQYLLSKATIRNP